MAIIAGIGPSVVIMSSAHLRTIVLSSLFLICQSQRPSRHPETQRRLTPQLLQTPLTQQADLPFAEHLQ